MTYFLFLVQKNVSKKTTSPSTHKCSLRVDGPLLEEKLGNIKGKVPVTVADRSNACTVFARAYAGTLGSNSTQVMDV
jgi:hypothetical protein